MPLDHLSRQAATLRTGRGIAHKSDIAPILERLGVAARQVAGIGDDCAIIPDGDGYLLLAIEGFLNEFVQSDPWFAGYCGVMVNASDVAAMGGRPVAVVDAIWSDGQSNAAPIVDGLAAAAAAYAIPIVGGHTNTRNAGAQLSVAILGRANRLITSFAASPGDVVLAAIDLRAACAPPPPGGMRAPMSSSRHACAPTSKSSPRSPKPGCAAPARTSAWAV